MTDDVLRPDEKEALASVESREKLNMKYKEDEKILLLRDRLIKSREALGEIRKKFKEYADFEAPDQESDFLKCNAMINEIGAIARTHLKGGK